MGDTEDRDEGDHQDRPDECAQVESSRSGIPAELAGDRGLTAVDSYRPLTEGSLLRRDPVAEYDVAVGKLLKPIRFMEVARSLPWLLRHFTGRVPDDMVARVSDDAVEVPCTCPGKPVTLVPWNVATPCNGTCGRYFWLIAGGVRVGYQPEDEPPSIENA